MTFCLRLSIVLEENCAFLGYYAASSGNFSYHYLLRNNPGERSFHLLRGGSLKLRKITRRLPYPYTIKQPKKITVQNLDQKLKFKRYYRVQFLEKDICVVVFWLERVKGEYYETH